VWRCVGGVLEVLLFVECSRIGWGGSVFGVSLLLVSDGVLSGVVVVVRTGCGDTGGSCGFEEGRGLGCVGFRSGGGRRGWGGGWWGLVDCGIGGVGSVGSKCSGRVRVEM